MNDIEILRPEVKFAIEWLDANVDDTELPEWECIRAELLRLARENAEFHRKDADARIARNCEHELKKWRK